MTEISLEWSDKIGLAVPQRKKSVTATHRTPLRGHTPVITLSMGFE